MLVKILNTVVPEGEHQTAAGGLCRADKSKRTKVGVVARVGCKLIVVERIIGKVGMGELRIKRGVGELSKPGRISIDGGIIVGKPGESTAHPQGFCAKSEFAF